METHNAFIGSLVCMRARSRNETNVIHAASEESKIEEDLRHLPKEYKTTTYEGEKNLITQRKTQCPKRISIKYLIHAVKPYQAAIFCDMSKKQLAHWN